MTTWCSVTGAMQTTLRLVWLALCVAGCVGWFKTKRYVRGKYRVDDTVTMVNHFSWNVSNVMDSCVKFVNNGSAYNLSFTQCVRACYNR